MFFNLAQLPFLLETLIFASAIFMHITRKNSSMVWLYLLQSFLISIMLFKSSLENLAPLMILAIVVIFIVKVIIAPTFFFRLIKRHQLKFSSSTYLNVPLTLIALGALTVFSYSRFFSPLIMLAADKEDILLLAFAGMLISIFLIINRRGVLSQMIGILSLENSIVSFASLSKLEQTPALQLGIIFDILVWVTIATVFVSMIYKQFGSLDAAEMQELKEE